MSLHGPEKHLRQHWTLDESRAFLNHGSYGACPRIVLEYQHSLRMELERSPVHFMGMRYPELLQSARTFCADFLASRPEHFVFVENATSGVNSVLKSLYWQAGDEIVLTNHGYNACRNAAATLSERFGVVLRIAEIPFPPEQSSQVTSAVTNCLSSRTKLVMIDHITSPTALVFPIEELAAELSSAGVPLLVDGAHAPGMMSLDLEALGKLGVTYYTGNFHKWCCSPKGAAFLWVHEKDQEGIRPLVTSHGFNSRSSRSKFLEEFDWCGSFDPTARLSVPAALRFLERLYTGGWPELRRSCRELLEQGRELVASQLPEQPRLDPAWLGQIVSLRLPEGESKHLYETLYEEFLLDSMITPWNGNVLLRLSAAPYNEIEDYERLSEALAVLRERGWK